MSFSIYVVLLHQIRLRFDLVVIKCRSKVKEIFHGTRHICLEEFPYTFIINLNGFVLIFYKLQITRY